MWLDPQGPLRPGVRTLIFGPYAILLIYFVIQLFARSASGGTLDLELPLSEASDLQDLVQTPGQSGEPLPTVQGVRPPSPLGGC